MTDLPPELDEEDYEPQLPDPAGHDAFAADEREALVGFDNEDERAEMRPVDPDHQYGHGTPSSGIGDTWYDPQYHAYKELGGLARPDAYFGAIEFDCPTCEAKGKTLDSDGEKCKVYVERIDRWHTRKMPCVARIKLATERGIL